MKKLEIKSTKESPYILLDLSKGILKIKGKSLSETPIHHYKGLIDFVEKNKENLPESITTILDLEYISPSSIKYIISVLEILSSKTSINIIWICDEDDSDMIEASRYFRDIVGLVPFFVIERKKSRIV